jgi:2-pyrone-4,6-dicarboxylate lactonase
MSGEPLVSLPLRPLETVSHPTFPLPAGAWDAHVHIFGPAARYPHVEKPHYTLPDGTLAQYRSLMPRLGIERFVIVQPSFYGCDNSCLIDTLAEVGDRARGVVMIEPDVSDAELEVFHRRGVRAVRLDLFKRAREPLAAVKTYIKQMAARVNPLGWHLQFYAPGERCRPIL